MNQLSAEEEDLDMLVVMGVTGAGKSYFINRLVGKYVSPECDALHRGTVKCQMIPTVFAGRKILVIDTPGFDEVERTDTEILAEIASILTAQYELGVKLRGIIYLHRITDIKYQGSAIKTLQIFHKVCGTGAMKNVILCTTRWQEVDGNLGAKRERELKYDFWNLMVSEGSVVTRFYGDEDSAQAIVGQLLFKDTVVLDIQRELSDEGLDLNQTAAAQFLSREFEKAERRHEENLDDLENESRRLRRPDHARQTRIVEELKKEKQRLQLIQAQQTELAIGKPVAGNVRHEIKKKRRFKKALGYVPLVLAVLGAFVGIPPGLTMGFSNIVTGGDSGSFSDLFQ